MRPSMASSSRKQRRFFADALSATIADPEHSLGEQRFITLGMSHRQRLVVVGHTETGDRIRIISAAAPRGRNSKAMSKESEEVSERNAPGV